MRRNRIIWLVVVLVLALAGSAAYTIRNSRTKLTYVVDSLLTADGAYVVDDDGAHIQLFDIDKSGRIRRRISLPKYRDEIMRMPSHLQVDPSSGRVYVYIVEHSVLTHGIALEAVYECDFDRGELLLRWEIPNIDPNYQVADHVAVRGGVLHYVTTDFVPDGNGYYTGQAQVWQMADSDTPEMLGAASYNADEYFSECYYTDNGLVVFTNLFGDVFYRNIGEEEEIPPPQVSEPVAAQQYGEDLGIIGDIPAREALQPEAVLAGRDALGESEKVPLAGFSWENALDPAIQRVEGVQAAKLSEDGGHVLYIADDTRGQVVSLDLATMEQGVRLDMTAWRANDYAAYRDLKNVRFVADGSFSASLPTPEGRSVLGVYDADGRSRTFDSLRLEEGKTFRLALLAFLAIVGACVLLWLLRLLFFWITNGKVPIVSKLIAAFIPVVIASMVGLGWFITNLFSEEMVNNQYKELLLVSQQQMAGLTSNLVRALAVGEDGGDVRATSLYHYEMRDLLGAVPLRSKIAGADGEQDVYNIAYHWVYRLDEQGKLHSLLCDQNYMNIPIEYYHTPTVVDSFYEAIRKDMPVKGEFRDVGGDWICLLIPIHDDTGTTIAVLETTTTRASLDYVVRNNTRKINNINAAILVALLVLLSGIIVYSLYPLNKLRKCVQEITYGKLGVQTQVRGNDEVAEIADTFNKMSTSIQYSVDELRGLNDSYHKFVPSQMFEILNKTSVTDVRLGDQTNTEVTVMEISPVNFDELVSGLSVGDMFQLLNNILSTIVPVIIRQGGVIDKFTSGGCIAFFTANSEAAFASSITALQQIDLQNRQGGFARTVEMAAGISYGPVMIGIVGHAERLEATNISEHTNLVGYLGRIAPMFNARVLTTATTLELVREYGDKYHARNIGFLRIRSGNQMYKLYDVFDGDEKEIRFLKQQTKELFEKGVELYCQRRFYDARLVFIEVLKKFRQDAAAKEYLYLCDQYYQRSNPEDVDICIAKY